MSDHSETGGRPLATHTYQPEGTNPTPTTPHHRRRRTSQSSDERIGGTKSTARRRPGTKTDTTLGPHVGSSRGNSSTMQRSTSPTQMSPESVHYTRTGRISKAKKGLKVHNCERHQKNHAQDALLCDFPGCGKPFYRIDLLQRHQERHNEVGNDSPQAVFSPGSSAEPDAQVSVSTTLPAPLVTAVPQTTPYYPQSISPLPESAADPSHAKQRGSFSARQTSAANMPVAVEGLQTNIAWNDPFHHSPNYSSSSGYASPIPGASDYANMFANPPYGSGSNRTRTSSNASFGEPWSYPSRSPTSATSTMAYTWTSNDKSPAPSHLAYMTTSYPMTSMPMSAGVDPMGYGHYGTKTMAQRDQEEQEFLFPEQSYGMGQIAQTYPFEQYLDNFWRHFHPTFPVVHRVTFESVTQSPMLHAAMIAIGGQYSNDALVKRKSRILHDRCMKLLDKRDLDIMTEADRLCDWQALFLIEVLSQYRARRAATRLSSRFETLYHRFCESFRIITSNIVDNLTSLAQPENVTYERWAQWVEMSTQQRLLVSCYILEHQQATLLARNPQQSLIHFSGFDLPLPSHSALWDATTPTAWAIESRQYAHLPAYVCQITSDLASTTLDTFQSSLLIAANYNHFNNPAPYLSSSPFMGIDHLVHDSALTKHQLLTAKLLQATPIRALLAVSGESWILSEKVPSSQAFSSYKVTLRTWIAGLWTDSSEPHSQPVKNALKLAIEILQHAMAVPKHALRLELGADMGLYYAALIIWTVTVAANTRINGSQISRSYQSHTPLSAAHSFSPTSSHLTLGTPGTTPNPTHPAALCLLPDQGTSTAPSSTTNCMLHSEINMTSITFLDNALMELNYLGIIPQWPRDVAQWQQGCSALMRWVKMRLRNTPIEGRDSVVMTTLSAGPTSAATGRSGDGFGELLDGAIGVIEKIMSRGWEGWGI
ncbi:hypothetical protein P280DRAFT_494410 [Massarina eburnea CBS 473.64]|uniref:C2H2-type domain-containing protein n=1 Tax=Massarina eburnea CBS 473.64 TaxID=1395130 RepID=A0A6A6RGS1_9PLEO|nr:hypothetical protein P280DRAFT_494410 [Massarina eburnea CBS 473.64]